MAPPAPAKTRATWLPWVALAALAAGVGVWEARRPVTTPENPLANAQFTRFTDWEGTEEGAEISPDGKFVAFLADREGEFDLWLSQVGTGRFSNLTRDFPPLAASGFIVRKLGFSGDGAAIWFNPADGKPLLLMDLIGGTPRAFLGEGANIPAWSPDDTRLVYVYKPNRDDPMLIADRTGANARQLLAPGVLKNNNPVWSPDGQWIYFVARNGAAGRDEHERVAPSILGRIAGAADQPARGREFSGAARRAHAALRGARGGLVGALALGARRRTQGHTPGEFGCRSIHIGIGQSRRPARGRHGRQPEREPLARAAARPARRRSRRPALRVAGADGAGAGAALRRQLVVLSVRPWDGRRTLEGPRRTGVRKSGARRTSRCTSRPLCRRTAAASSSSSDTRGNGTCRSCRRTARTRSRSPRPSK